MPTALSSNRVAALSSDERSRNRLSRVTASEFDKILQSGDTVQVSQGRDEKALGKSAQILDSGSSRLAGRDLEGDGKRRSIHRSVGTASSPDLASLIRKAREERDRDLQGEVVEELEASGDEEEDLTDLAEEDTETVQMAQQVDDGPQFDATALSPHVPPPTPTPAAITSPAPRKDSLPSPSKKLSRNKPQSLKNLDSTSFIPPSDSLSSELSSRQGPSPPESSGSLPAIPTRAPGFKAAGTFMGVGPSEVALDMSDFVKRNRSLGNFGDDLSTKSASFSSTMRKTSRFFRKFGSSSSFKSSSSSAGSAGASAPGTPTSSSFPSFPSDAAPPVPAIPASYVSNSSIGVETDLPPIPLPVLAILNRTRSREREHSAPLPTESSSKPPAMVKGHARKRSLSLSSLVSPMLKDGQTRGTDDERLRSELQSWKVDLDAVLGSIGDGSGLRLSPNVISKALAQKSASAPPTPTIALPAFSPLDMSFSRPASLPRSAERYRPTWDPTWTKETMPTSSTILTPVPLRSASQPNPILQSFDHLSTRSASPVPPPDTLSSSPAPSITPPTNLRDKRNSIASDLPNSLETITEMSHSRESSAVVTPAKGKGSSPRPVTPTLSGTHLPLLRKSSPTPLPNIAALRARKDAVRQSLVAYPNGRSPSGASASTSSLPSRLGSNVSLEAGSPEAGNRADQALGEASLDERAKTFAQRCWDEDETFLEKKKIAEWLGSTGRLNDAARRYYIDNFDFSGLRLDLAFRRLCDKLYLKAETQQVDRILEQFSRRYWVDNPNVIGIYGSSDIVYAVSYSLLLLNTDLHVVDTTTRMSRMQFVRNTLAAVHAQSSIDEATPGLLFGANSPTESPSGSTSVFGGEEGLRSNKSLDRVREGAVSARRAGKSPMDPTSSLANFNSVSPRRPKTAGSVQDSPVRILAQRSASMATIGNGKNWDVELESVLKEMYNAIKAQPVFQPSSPSPTGRDSRMSMTLSPGSSPYGTWSGGAINRSASRKSTASTMSSSSAAFKRASVRGFGSFLGASSAEFARSTSPTPSTSTSFSDENQSYGSSSYHHIATIGFANSLSHTIIREQQEDDVSDGEADMTEEELALLGAPWAKEGLIWRKHYWEAVGKRAKEKTWLQAFVVISQGELQMFRFDGAGTVRGTGSGVGGGDWTSNAQSVGSVSLIHALCSAMPPPGYNRSRPHCYVLSLPSGGSYFFQAGTQDLVGEWVSTCNYWSARLSKEPLTGGVSNMDYGWNRVPDADDAEVEVERMSIRSGKSAVSRKSYVGGFASISHNKNDKIFINDWKPPVVPTGASTLSEEAQLASLKKHVAIVHVELDAHNNIRAPMYKLYSSRSTNLSKAATNWDRKSQHLLSEIVKYTTYIDALTSSGRLRSLKRGQKEVDDLLAAADEVEWDEKVTSSRIEANRPLPVDSSIRPVLLVRTSSPTTLGERRSVDSRDQEFFDPQTPTASEGRPSLAVGEE